MPARCARIGVHVLVAVLLVALALSFLIVEPWRGPVILVFSSNHGFDLGNLPVVALLVTAGIVLGKVPIVARCAARARPVRRTWLLRPTVAARGAGTVLLAVGLSELTDGGGQHARAIEALTALLVLLSIVWLLAAVGRDAVPPAVAFMVGAGPDALAVPSGTLFGPLLVAAYLANRTTRAWGSALLWCLVLVLGGGTAASLANLDRIDVPMADGQGGPARTAALGMVLVAAGTIGATQRWDARARS